MKVAIIYYSTYGHIVTMAELVKEGLDKSGVVSLADIFQIPETLSDEVLAKMYAGPKASYPIATNDTLVEYDAFLLGIPTRFGNMPAQWKDFWDSTGGLWQTGALYGKPVGFFVSTAGQGGGQETTVRNCMSVIAHHGMIYIPLGYATAFQQITSFDEVHGSSPYGAGTIAASDGSRQPSALEKEIAAIQGESFAKSAVKFARSPAAPKTDEKVVPELKQEPETVTVTSRTAQRKREETSSESGCGVKCVVM